ncbi:hypothetical protein J1N35_037068 [Gossypium stocksii]|uniref:Uncharacterized protein n=1 Tax=Gossypium stocksii TaxID=47602 RepID=A0A9D3UK18_9ROSI|nr:hypothetical protein J1N35_037068 [Gossypium stocksii]
MEDTHSSSEGDRPQPKLRTLRKRFSTPKIPSSDILVLPKTSSIPIEFAQPADSSIQNADPPCVEVPAEALLIDQPEIHTSSHTQPTSSAEANDFYSWRNLYMSMPSSILYALSFRIKTTLSLIK